GRALVSLVNVLLSRMRPSFLPGLFGFSYRHVAFRLLVDDPASPPPDPEAAGRGIFFVRSFTDRPLLAHAGSLLTYYRLTPAEMAVDPRGLAVRAGGRRLSYRKAVLASAAPSPRPFRR